MSTTSGESELSLYRTIVARMTEGVALLRVSDASIVWTNPRLDAIFGGSEADLRGAPSSSLLVRDGADLEPIRSALSRHGTWDG
ncbi:MAG: hypothetical protein QOF76_3612, partial [Solirubrobacteraceae bacterium]|nr:hypothetical protein [Solirubrobacteraceae bacterium]